MDSPSGIKSLNKPLLNSLFITLFYYSNRKVTNSLFYSSFPLPFPLGQGNRQDCFFGGPETKVLLSAEKENKLPSVITFKIKASTTQRFIDHLSILQICPTVGITSETSFKFRFSSAFRLNQHLQRKHPGRPSVCLPFFLVSIHVWWDMTEKHGSWDYALFLWLVRWLSR